MYRERSERRRQIRSLTEWVYARLGVFTGSVDLEVHSNLSSFGEIPLNHICEFCRRERFEDIETFDGCEEFGLVRLERTYKVPCNVFRQLHVSIESHRTHYSGLLGHFLDIVFAEMTMSGVVQRLDIGRRLDFGDGDEAGLLSVYYNHKDEPWSLTVLQP